jgi:hypothetical protein
MSEVCDHCMDAVSEEYVPVAVFGVRASALVYKRVYSTAVGCRFQQRNENIFQVKVVVAEVHSLRVARSSPGEKNAVSARHEKKADWIWGAENSAYTLGHVERVCHLKNDRTQLTRR